MLALISPWLGDFHPLDLGIWLDVAALMVLLTFGLLLAVGLVAWLLFGGRKTREQDRS